MALNLLKMQTIICTILLILLHSIPVTDALIQRVKEKRKLNTRKYFRVLDIISSITPTVINDPNGPKFDKDHDVIYFDKKCATENYGVQHLCDEFMKDISECFATNPNNPDINDVDPDDFFIFISLKKNKQNCVPTNNVVPANTMVDMEAYCISKITYEAVFEMDAIRVQSMHSTSPRPWNLEVTEAIYPSMSGYDNYHYEDMQHSNLNVYILDQTVRLSHQEFSNLATKQYLAETTGDYVPWNHGTHVAATIIGKTVGIIRDNSVGLFSCGCCTTAGSCYWSRISACFNAVIAHLGATSRRGAINYSVGGGKTPAYDSYLAQLRAVGGIFVTSAGNSDDNACNQSPAESSDAIAVGSFTSSFARSYFSNFGNCVNAWAPGSSIYSAFGSSSDTEYGTMSGTSMASPAVAGLVGRLLLRNPSLTFDNIQSILSCSYYGRSITDAQSTVSTAFGASVGDIHRITANPNQCTSLANSNDIQMDEIVTNDINVAGQRDCYRVKVSSGTTDIHFANTAGALTCLSFFDTNFGSLITEQCDGNTLQVPSVANGDYWLGVTGDTQSVGSYTITMNDGTAVAPIPTSNPSKRPTANPSKRPTANPSKRPTTAPPTRNPTQRPTANPSKRPTSNPSDNPSKRPTDNPSVRPTANPSRAQPIPSQTPTSNPSKRPTSNPSVRPTDNPSVRPTANPSVRPTDNPSVRPSANPSARPTTNPSVRPTANPTQADSNAYIILCSGDDVCKGSTLQCTANNECVVNCVGKSACNDATIQGNTATDLTVLCSDEDACKGTTNIYCGRGACSVTCIDATSCEGTLAHTHSASGATFMCTGYCAGVQQIASVANSNKQARKMLDGNTNENEIEDENAYEIEVGASTQMWMVIWAIFGVVLILNFMLYKVCCGNKLKANELKVSNASDASDVSNDNDIHYI